MMSIGVVTYSTRPRGSVAHATSLAEAIVQAGHDATVYALGKSGAAFWRPLACNVEIFPARDAPTDTDTLIRQRIDELVAGLRGRETRHDIWHAQDCLAANALLALRRDVPPPHRVAPVMRTVHHVESFASPYLASCQRRSILEADAVLSVSRLTQRDVYDQFGRETAIVPNGVDLGRFPPRSSAARMWLRARFGISPDDTVIVSVGGVEPRKNTRRALEAVAMACARDPRLSWLVVGGDSIWDHSGYAAAFEADLAALPPEVAARVVRPGTLSESDLTALYGVSDILLCASEHEGFGLCVLEAMAAGAAVIAPDAEPFTEYLDGSSALLVDRGSPEAISNALLRLVRDPALRARLTASARLVASRFSWTRSADIHLAHYEALRSSNGAAFRPPSRESHGDA
jgi:glycosyltransferase-like protein